MRELIAFLTAAIGCTHAAYGENPTFEFKPTKPGDVLSANAEGTLITVQSKTGIGGGSIKLAKGAWPKTVTIRFQHEAGRPFKGLESFKLNSEKFRIEGSLKDSGTMRYSVLNNEGKFEPKPSIDVRVKPADAGLDVILPPDLLKDVKSIELQWIDFYRG
jgi:hypothetical protein